MRCSAHYEVSDSEDIVDVLTDALCGYIGAPRVMRMLRRHRISSTSCSPKSLVSAALKAATHKRKLSSATRKACLASVTLRLFISFQAKHNALVSHFVELTPVR